MKNFKIKSIHLDVSRSFIPLEELYTRVDEFSELGFTHLQLGLSDDQGWRFESFEYPRLHIMGSKRSRKLLSNSDFTKDKEPYGGYYTQLELRSLVKYARHKSISIIPLLDLPGHSSCAILAYPRLASNGVPKEVPTTRGAVLFRDKSSTMCYTNSFTKSFISTILDELHQVFEPDFIHLGFDEIAGGDCKCGNCNIGTLTKLLQIAYNKVLILGSKPIIWWRFEKHHNIDVELFPHLTLQWWGASSLDRRLNIKNDIIFSQPQNLYLDYPGSIGGRITSLEDMGVTLVQPHSLQDKIKKFPDNIIGIGVCLWTENLHSQQLRTIHLYPRLNIISKILKGLPISKYQGNLSLWANSSYLSSLIKVIRSSNLDEEDKSLISLYMESNTLPEIIKFIKSDYPQVDFKSVSLRKISNSIKGILKINNSNELDELNKLYNE